MMFKHVCDVACRATCEVPIAYLLIPYGISYGKPPRSGQRSAVSTHLARALGAARFFPGRRSRSQGPCAVPIYLESRAPRPPAPGCGVAPHGT